MSPPNSTPGSTMSNTHHVQHPHPPPPDNTSPPHQVGPNNALDDIIESVRAAAGSHTLSRPNSLIRTDSSSSSSTPERDKNDHPLIGPDLYMFIVNADEDQLLALENNWPINSPNCTMWELKSPGDKNCALHIAAESGQENLITEFLLPRCPSLAKMKNFNGDLPVHSAAKAGKLGALKALTTWDSYPSSEGIGRELLGWGNDEEDTPLHIAVENDELEMALYLMEIYGESCYQLNSRQVCPMYMAIKAGYWELVYCMVSFTRDHNPDSGIALLRGKSIVHAAIAAKKLDILRLILENHENLIESFDEGDQTPLSYAAFKGCCEEVDYLLDKFPIYAYKRDKDGAFPIHSAAKGGHSKILKKLDYTRRLLNRKQQNILHVAAGNGKSEVVSYLLKELDFKKLINSKDEDGNTPLHLATKGFHPRVVYMLTWEKRVKRESQNKDGLTALDVAEIHAGLSPPFEVRLTWMALRYVDAPRSSQATRASYISKKSLWTEELLHAITSNKMITNKTNEKSNLENYKDRIGTHLLVATLVATVTFAAGFTLPGGYIQSDKNIGMAVLAHKWAFQVFVICDTAAMYSSILSVVTLIWAQLGDLKLLHASLKVALPLLGFSLSMMSLAFLMGMFVVLRNTLWLSFVVLSMGSVFMVVVLLIFIPLYNPSSIKNSVVRYFFSGTFLLLLLVCDKTKIRDR